MFRDSSYVKKILTLGTFFAFLFISFVSMPCAAAEEDAFSHQIGDLEIEYAGNLLFHRDPFNSESPYLAYIVHNVRVDLESPPLTPDNSYFMVYRWDPQNPVQNAYNLTQYGEKQELVME